MDFTRHSFLFVFVGLCILSCQHTSLNDEEDAPAIAFRPRTSDTLFIKTGTYSDGFKWEEEGPHNLLYIQIADLLRDDNCLARDVMMESEITRFLTSSYPWYRSSGYPITIEYRQEVCTSIVITSSLSVGGFAPGEDISSLFYFFVAEDSLHNHSFILSGDTKQWVDSIKTGMTINQYLSHKPFIFPFAVLKLSQDLFFSEGIQLTVRVSFKNSESISSTITE